VYSPEPLLDALSALPDSDRGLIELRFVGRVADQAAWRLRSGPVKTLLTGFLPQREALGHLEDSDCLLVIVNNANAQAAKLFEYLPTGKPILAISPSGGEIDQLIRASQTGWCVDPTDQRRLKEVLQIMIEIFVHGNRSLLPERRSDVIELYSRTRLIEELTRLTAIGAYRCR
jgi:glycosyltransferase involved in cell wall biosynthesis